MDSTVLECLKRHSDGTSDANDASVLADLTWMARQGTDVGQSIDLIWADLAAQLGRLNKAINHGDQQVVHRDIVYTVNSLILLCITVSQAEQSKASGSRFATLAWQISCAWDAVLSGDIEDIREHVHLELRMRFPKRQTKQL